MQPKFIYLGIRVKDIAKSVDFYTKVFGMKENGRSRIAETKGDVVGLESSDGKLSLELNHYDEDSPYFTDYAAGEGLDHIAFSVPNLDEALGELRGMGIPIAKEVKTATSRWAYVEDPNGIWIDSARLRRGPIPPSSARPVRKW